MSDTIRQVVEDLETTLSKGGDPGAIRSIERALDLLRRAGIRCGPRTGDQSGALAQASPESIDFGEIDATTPAFLLGASMYNVVVTANAWRGGSVSLERSTASGFAEAAPPFTADGHRVVKLPRGRYRFALAAAGEVHTSVVALNGATPPPELYLTEEQFAQRYQVGRRTAQRWRRTGQGPAWVRWGPRAVRYRVADVERWAVSRTFRHRADELAHQTELRTDATHLRPVPSATGDRILSEVLATPSRSRGARALPLRPRR
jgi:predicted DNA-binding transcriptional regulator AlpA